jgi:hypothetical protein
LALPSTHSTPPRSSAVAGHCSHAVLAGWLLALFAVLCSALIPSTTYAAPSLILPTVPGENWRIIQGYGCGTHGSWDRYALDLVQVDGPTYDAPIRAAAAGEIWAWESSSGTIILSHGGGFFTMYTHLARAVSTQRGRFYNAGETLGFAGDRGSPGVPHLHFLAYTANRDGWRGKQSVPLQFAEGYHFPEIGGCNQHGGATVKAASLQDPQVEFASPAQPAQWYNSDQRIEFRVGWGGGGVSQAWNGEPAADDPMFPGNTDGYAQLAEAGEGLHRLVVRAWSPDGRQSLASYGPVGYDITPPTVPAPIAEVRAPAGSVAVAWQPATDALSGMAGYRLYIGDDPEGSSDWFTTEPAVKTQPLAPGRYLVRVQSVDNAGNTSAWVTIGSITVTP